MRKWTIIDDTTTKRATVEFRGVFDSKEEALDKADDIWNFLAEQDKKARDAFTVALCDLEQDENGNWDFVADEKGTAFGEMLEIAKEYC